MKYLKLFELFSLITEELREEGKQQLLKKQSNGKKSLILIPGAGGDAYDDFEFLIKNLGNDFSIYTANFPEKVDVRRFAERIANEINEHPEINYFAVGGYSIGGSMAWHICRNIKKLQSEKKFKKQFKNKLFFIDSGIANSTEEFAAGLEGNNPSRYAFAFNFEYFKKSRNGEKITDEEVEKNRSVFWNKQELDNWKKNNKGEYLDYTGKDNFPPSNLDIENKIKEIRKTDNTFSENPYIIEDKFDITNFEKRYSNYVKIGANVKGNFIITGDKVVINKFKEIDTLKKRGLGRETKDPNKSLPALEGVKVVSIMAGLTKDKRELSEEEKEKAAENTKKSSTSKNSITVFIEDADHQKIVKSPALAEKIKKYW